MADTPENTGGDFIDLEPPFPAPQPPTRPLHIQRMRELRDLQIRQMLLEQEQKQQQQSQQPKHIRRIKWREILETPEPEWLVRGIIAKQSITLLYGDPFVGKSTFIGHMLAAIYNKTPFLDLPEVPPIRATLITDVGTAGLKNWGRKLNFPEEPDRNPDDCTLDFMPTSLQPPNISFQDLTAQLQNEVSADNTDLIILDCFQSCTGVVDINNYSEVTAIFQILQRLKDETGVSICAIHHGNKLMSSDIIRSVLGSQALAAQSDTILTFRRSPKEDNYRIVQGYGRDIADINFAYTIQDGQCVLVDNVEEPGENSTKILQYLAENLTPEKPTATRNDIAENTGIPSSTVNRLLVTLLQNGHIQKEGGGRTTSYKISNDMTV